LTSSALPYLEEADEFWSASAINFMRIAMSMNDTNLFPFSNHSSCSAKEDVYEAYTGQGMKEKAIQALTAISIPAKLPEINETLIVQYYRNCQDSFFKLANIYLDDKNYSEAINTLNPLLNHVKDISHAYFLRYIAFDGEKDFESAKEDLLKVIDLEGKTASNYVMLGDLYLGLRQYDDVEKAYKDALKIEPNNPRALHNLGVCFGRQGQKTIAADYYYRAGIIYLKNNKRDSALLALDNLKKMESEFYDKLFFAIYKEKPNKERSKDKEKN
jgi:tetratricopeptide (TPR) repeat protein